MSALTVSDVARDAGVAPSAVRFYEARGLITATRTSGGQRRFDANSACLIRVARVAQRVGLTVKEIAERFSELPSEPQPEDWHRFSDQLIAEAESRVAALREQMSELRGDAKLCEIVAEPPSRTRLGAGARASRGTVDA